MHFSPHKVGIAFGAFLGVFHLAWAALVFAGLGQPLLDFIFNLHMIHPVYQVGPFEWGMAGMLVVITALIGYAFGFVLTVIWNRVHKN